MPQVNLALENSRLRAQAEDPNEMRCLIENRPKEDAGVDIAHVLPRHTAGNAELVRCRLSYLSSVNFTVCR